MGQGEVERQKLLDQIRELQVHVAQLIQAQPKPNEVPSARTPESEPRLPLPQPNATPREFPHDQLCIPKEITEQIPKFDGYNISARDFIKSCENATTKLVRYSIQDIIQTFKSRLMGSAYRLLIGVEFHTIEEFLDAVKKTFSPRKTANQYIGEIGNLRQNPNETVMQYACRTRELETALIDSIKTEFPENSAQIINKVETDLLKGFTDGITTSIRTELRLNGNKTLTDAIADAIALEKKTTPNPPNPSYNRNNNNRNPNGRYEERYTNTENRTYRFNYNQDRRYPDQPPRYTDRNNDNFNRPDNRNNYNSNQNRRFYNDRNPDHENKRYDRYQNPQSRFTPEDRRGYYNQNYREQRPGDYREYNTPPNPRSQNVGNLYAPPGNVYAPPNTYESNRYNSRTNDPPTGTRIAQVIQPEPNWCKLCKTTDHPTAECKRINAPTFIPANFSELAGIPRVVKARIKPNTPVTLLIDTGSQLNLIKEHLLTPGTTITEPYNLPLQGIGEGTVRTLGTVTLEIFSRTALFHIVPRSMPTPGDGILGDEFFMNTGVTIDYIKQHIHFQDIYVPFYDGESVVIGAKETRQIEIMILNPEVKEGILNRHESMPGLYIEKTIVRHEEGRVVVKVVNETDKEIVIKVPTLAISPLEEGVTPVVRNLEDGKATSGVDSRTKILTTEDNLSDNVEIEESVLTRPVGKATSDVDSREEEVMIDRISNTTSVVGEQVTMNLGKLDRREIGKVMEESENKNVLISGKNREEELKLIEKEIREMKLNNEVKKICENHVGNKEINDDRSNVGKELGKIKLYCEERKKEVSGMEAEKLEDGKAASGVDSHTNETAPGKKPLVIVTCEGLATKKNNEDSFREIEIENFNEEYNDTIIDLMNTYENLWEKELEIDEEKSKSFIEACRELGNIESDEVHEKLTDIKRTATHLDKGNFDTICELDNAVSVVDTRVNQHSGGIDQIEIGKEAERKNDSEIAIGDNILEPNTKMNYLSFCNLSTETAVRVGFDHNPDNIKTVNQEKKRNIA
ncbi:hypothetical protein M0802_015092 [Mischocyttarus mexicanus]|nr:hypothetical protein M0802_015092 [Mischocyttarus mexicanus]